MNISARNMLKGRVKQVAQFIAVCSGSKSVVYITQITVKFPNLSRFA
jgi:molybdopterin-binding protein